MPDGNSKLLLFFEKAPWNVKMQVLQVLSGWNQDQAADKYGTSQKQVWAWNSGENFPRKYSRKAIAEAHGVAVQDIFPIKLLKPDELKLGA